MSIRTKIRARAASRTSASSERRGRASRSSFSPRPVSLTETFASRPSASIAASDVAVGRARSPRPPRRCAISSPRTSIVAQLPRGVERRDDAAGVVERRRRRCTAPRRAARPSAGRPAGRETTARSKQAHGGASPTALAHEALAGGADERHRLGEEHAHRVAQRDRLLVRRRRSAATCFSAAAVSSTAVFSVSVANCSRCASLTLSDCVSANSRSPRRISSGSPPNGKKPPPSMTERSGYGRLSRRAARGSPLDLLRQLVDRALRALHRRRERRRARPGRAPARAAASPRRSRRGAPARRACGGAPIVCCSARTASSASSIPSGLSVSRSADELRAELVEVAADGGLLGDLAERRDRDDVPDVARDRRPARRRRRARASERAPSAVSNAQR